ncbi:MAG TPA: hypothetical protein VFZ32_20880 [Micromonosporaceae bacterium]
MATVVVVLESGFSGHRVVITVDGDTVLEAVNVTTDRETSLAGSVAVACGPLCRIEVLLPDQGAAEEVTLHLTELTYLRVSLQDGRRPILTPSREGPRYV